MLIKTGAQSSFSRSSVKKKPLLIIICVLIICVYYNSFRDSLKILRKKYAKINTGRVSSPEMVKLLLRFGPCPSMGSSGYPRLPPALPSPTKRLRTNISEQRNHCNKVKYLMHKNFCHVLVTKLFTVSLQTVCFYDFGQMELYVLLF